MKNIQLFFVFNCIVCLPKYKITRLRLTYTIKQMVLPYHQGNIDCSYININNLLLKRQLFFVREYSCYELNDLKNNLVGRKIGR